MFKVKVCGMKDPLNVRDISGIKPDFMGFIFFKGSERYVGENYDPALFGNVPQYIKMVGVFCNEESENVLKLSYKAGLSIVQLHGYESSDYCMQLKSCGLTVIKSFNVGEKFGFDILDPYLKVCDYFLFDTKSNKPGGSGKKFDWSILDRYIHDKPFFLSGGIGPEDAGIIGKIQDERLYAIDINSRFEITPGIKDVSMVNAFINDIKN